MIKAIETRYAGCRFRSRLEARWAVFFDHMKIEWQYEPQGFELPSGPYLPDFYLPKWGRYDGGTADAWIEVKGRKATKREYQLLEELNMSTCSGKVFMLEGDIPRKPGFETPGRGYLNSEGWWGSQNDLASGRRAGAAIEAARSARFEHGQSPRRVR